MAGFGMSDFEFAKGLLLDFKAYVKWIHKLSQNSEYEMTESHALVCDKLQEYAEGKNKKRNLLINVFPGWGKSLLLQYFITWCFARDKDCMFCYVAYGERLIKKLSKESRNLLMLPEWEKLFGREMDPNDKSVLNYHLISGGIRSGLTAGTISSALLGLDAGNPAGKFKFSGALLCFPYNTLVRTREGLRKIGQIVENRENCEVLCSNGWGKVTNWIKRPSTDMVVVKYTGGQIKCTSDHKIYTDRGWVEAGQLTNERVALSDGKKIFAGRVLSVKKRRKTKYAYCLTVDCHNFFAGGDLMILCRNCDDINSTEVRVSVHEQIETPETYQRKLATRRRTPSTPTICILQRHCPNDFAGWILKNEPEDWELVKIKALSDGKSVYPKRYPLEDLLKIEKQNPFMFAAMYQQEPVENEGMYFHEEWIKTYRTNPEIQKAFITTDFGFTTTGDKSVFCCWGLGKDNNLYLLRSLQGKWESPDAKRKCIDFFQRCNSAYPLCRRVYIENTLSGIGFIQDMRRECPKMAIVPLKRGAKKNKLNRAESAMTWMESERVFFRESDPNFVPARAEFLSYNPADKNPKDEWIDNTGDATEIAFNTKTSSIFI